MTPVQADNEDEEAKTTLIAQNNDDGGDKKEEKKEDNRVKRKPFPPLRAPKKSRRGTCYEWWHRSWHDRSIVF